MRNKALLVTVLFACCLTLLCACDNSYASQPSHTPTGVPCALVTLGGTEQGCFYFNDNGVQTACVMGPGGYDFCQNTTGGFYNYYGANGAGSSTYYCDVGSHNGCTSVNNPPVTDPVALCPTPTVSYTGLVNKGQAWKVVDSEQDQNNSSSPIQVTFNSTKSSTDTVSTSEDLTVDANFVYGEIEAGVRNEFNITTVNSVTTTISNAPAIQIPAHGVAHAIYGVKVQVTTGDLTTKDAYTQAPCTSLTAAYGRVTSYAPISSGWCIWINDQAPCPTVS